METTTSSRLLRFVREVLGKRADMADGEEADSGFTLIELMVVLLIMAILLAIAIPTFLGVTGGAQDRSAQSNLTNALTSAKSIYATDASYGTTSSLMTTLSSQEPELQFMTSSVDTGKPTNISVEVSTDGQQIIMVDYSSNNSGTCWAISDNNNSGATLGNAPNGTSYIAWKVASGTGCTAASVTASAPATTTNWQRKYPTGTPAAFSTL